MLEYLFEETALRSEIFTHLTATNEGIVEVKNKVCLIKMKELKLKKNYFSFCGSIYATISTTF